MREFSRVSPTFWTGHTGKIIRGMGPEARVLATYLITCPSANMLGLYYLPLPLIVHESGLTFEGASKGLRSLSEAGFADYDPETEHVWVREMARWQVLGTADALRGGDKRIRGVESELAKLSNNPYINDFRRKYAAILGIQPPADPKPLRCPSEGASKGLRCQEQEQEIEIEQRAGERDRAGGGAGSGPGARPGPGADPHPEAVVPDVVTEEPPPPGQSLIGIFRDLRLQLRPKLGHYLGSAKDDEVARRLLKALTSEQSWGEARGIYRRTVETYLRESKSETPTFSKLEQDFDHWRQRAMNGDRPTVEATHFGDPEEEGDHNAALLARLGASGRDEN